MANKLQKLLLSITTVLLANTLVLPQFCLAQSRTLPKTGFSNYTGGQLSPGAGVSLQGGGYRPKNAATEPYNPGEPKFGHKLVRWESRFMPLKVWISPGKKLPEEPIQTINEQRPQEVYTLINLNSAAVSSLQQCMAWSPEMNQAAIAGIEQWRPFQSEGLFSFQFVENPREANILLFWADRLTGDESAGGISTAGNTVAVLYDANQVHQAERQLNKPVHGTPVVIEVVANPEYEKLQSRIAHEFGHALGIKEHSPYNDDLMCVNGIAKVLSPADIATIRWLYRQQPAFIMLPPRYEPGDTFDNHAPLAVHQQSQQQVSPPNSQGQAASPANQSGYHIRGSGRPASDTPEDEATPGQASSYRRPSSGTGKDPGGVDLSTGSGGDEKDKKKDCSESSEKPKKEKKSKKDKDEEAPDVPIPSFMRQQLEEEERRKEQEQLEQKKHRKQPNQSQPDQENSAPPPAEKPSEGY